MNEGWQKVPLGELLTKSDRWLVLDGETQYKEVTVRLWGRGVALRGLVSGAAVAGTRRMQVRAGEFIASRIDARNGAFGLIPEDLDGAVVTNDFPVFVIDERCLLPEYLHWLSKTQDFVDACKTASEGTTNRVRLKEDRFLQIEIQLPKLGEQRRIVARLERVAAKITAAIHIRNASTALVDSTLNSVSNKTFNSLRCERKPVRDLCEAPQYGYTASASDQPVGPKMLRITDIQDGRVNWSDVPYCLCPNPSPFLLQTDDILFARTGATTGKSYLVDSCPEPAVFASYLIRLRIYDKVLPQYLYEFFQSPEYWAQITSSRQGTGQPNCNGRKLAEVIVPVPSISEQQRVVDYFGKLRTRFATLRTGQAIVASKLDALLPCILELAFRGEL